MGENHCRRLFPYGEWGGVIRESGIPPLNELPKRRADLAGNSGMEPRNCGYIVRQIELESVKDDGEVGARMPLSGFSARRHQLTPADRHKPSCRTFRAK